MTHTLKASPQMTAFWENMSESHYRSVFTREFGKSPIEYIISRRINAVAYLLESTNKKLGEIASMVGYNDVYYFGRQFKRKLGVSPGKYQRIRKK